MGKDITLLYVEDDAATRAFAKILFKKHDNIIVTFANDGVEALALYEQSSYDIVISDMNMPNMGGIALIENIKKLNSQQLVAMVSAMEQKEDFIQVVNLHIKYFLAKPLEAKSFDLVLRRLVETVIEKREAALNVALLEQYKRVVDATSILSKADAKGKITYVNEQFCKISQYSFEELIGQPHSMLRHPDMPKETFEDMWQTIQSKKTWHGKVKNRAKDGSSYIVDATIVPILGDNNEIIEYIGLRYDITELEQYKELLQIDLDTTATNLNQKIHTIAEYEKAINESASFSRTDLNGKIVHVNDNFCKINGYAKEEMLGRSHNLIRHPDMPAEFFRELWSTIKAKKVWKGIIKNLSKDGKTSYMSTTIVPILDLNEEPIEYMSIRFEVTDLIDLQKEIENTQKEVVYTMGAIGESRSKETGNHVKRVAEYSKTLALLYGMSEKEAETLRQASPMHDIGKVAIPDAVLNKPGKLDAQEWKIMQTHSELGYNMLKHSDRELLKAAAIVAYEHHEKWDGSGYPRGLQAEEIHVYGRITAIADVFDALGSDRCYKKAWELDEILQLFKNEREKQFQPELVDLFFENLDKFLEIRDRYKDTE